MWSRREVARGRWWGAPKSIIFGPGIPTGYRLFSRDGSWNKPVPSNPTISPRSASIIAKMTGWGTPRDIPVGAASSPVASDFDHPIYFPQARDPFFTIMPTDDAYDGWAELYGDTFRLPAGARGAHGTDSHLTCFDVNAGVSYDFYHFQLDVPDRSVPAGGGVVTAKAGMKVDINGSGWAITDPSSGGIAADAAWGALAGGLIMYEEIIAGKIDHALRMIVHSTDASFVKPANGLAGSVDPVDAPPCGARFWLDMTEAEIDALKCTKYNKIVYKALAKYGAYVTDTGSVSWALQLNSTEPWIVEGYDDPWRIWAIQNQLFYIEADDYYMMQTQDPSESPDWATKLKVLDWTDRNNY